MASEIRVNKITHTAGVGTITTNVDGIVVAGIVTANSFSGIFCYIKFNMVHFLQSVVQI